MSEPEITHHVVTLQEFLKSHAVNITRDKHKAEDLVQDTCLKAIRNRDNFVPGTNVKAWLYTILRNTFINNYRKEKTRATYTDSTPNQFYLNSSVSARQSEADHLVLYKEILASFRHVEGSIRTTFELYFQGFKYEEIAEKLNVPIGTVKSRIFKARKILQRQLSPYRD